MTNEEILKKLDTIIALLATQGKGNEDKHKVLKSLGFTYKDISKFLDVPEGTLKTWDFKKKK